jgi:hypothetical protein
MNLKPHIIDFSKIGKSVEGFISICEGDKHVPFEIKRVFWTYFTPDNIIRGRHAHLNTEMVLVAVAGKIIVNTEMPGGITDSFILDNPNVGVYLPKLCWHTMQYSHSSVQMVLTNTLYDEKDYVRSYDDFKKIQQVQK